MQALSQSDFGGPWRPRWPILVSLHVLSWLHTQRRFRAHSPSLPKRASRRPLVSSTGLHPDGFCGRGAQDLKKFNRLRELLVPNEEIKEPIARDGALKSGKGRGLVAMWCELPAGVGSVSEASGTGGSCRLWRRTQE